MGKKVTFNGFLIISILAILLPIVVILYGGEKSQQHVYNLSEISAFEVDENLHSQFTRGHLGNYSEQPEGEVQAYPAFKSDKPLYGLVRFEHEYGEFNPEGQYYFAIDESKGTGQGFDLLYFDFNRDFNLTNDTAVKAMENPPKDVLMNYSSISQQVCFNYLGIDFDFDSDGQRPIEVMPRLIIHEGGYASIGFVTTKAFKGEVDIAGQKYNVFLGHNYQISGWFDRPSTALHLIPKGGKSNLANWPGADRLRAIHKIAGTYYCFSATPAGDKLCVKPYKGEFGTFKIGSGGRLIFNRNMRGSVLSKNSALAVGTEFQDDRPKEVGSCYLPAGDYLPDMLNIELGSMKISISDNYHSDGKSRDRGGRPPVYGIKIRKNKPFVLDFSNKPDVVFASPAADCRVMPGDQLNVKAVLVDPKLDIMIRDIKIKPKYIESTFLIKLSILILLVLGMLWLLLPRLRRRYRFIPLLSMLGAVVLIGCLITLSAMELKINHISNNPEVLITRASGEKIAGGTMPFG